MDRLFNIGDEVTDNLGTQEGTIIAYTHRTPEYKESHMYKVRWKGFFGGSEWLVQSSISKIERTI